MLALKTSKQTVTQFAFSADGRYLAVAGTGRKVHLWDLTAKRLKAKVLPTFKDATEWLGFLPDGRLFALSKMGQSVRHDPAAGATVELQLGAGRAWVGNVLLTPDAKAFYATDRFARKWAVEGGHLHRMWSHPVSDTGAVGLAGRGGTVLTPEGTLVAAVSNYDNRTWFHVRDATTGALRGEHPAANSLIRDLTLLPDGKTLAFVREQEYRGPTPNAVVVGTLDGTFEALVTAKENEPKTFASCALHPSGKWLAVGQYDGTVRVFDAHSWREAVAYQWPVKPVAGLAFSPDGLKAAAGGEGGQFVVWDVDL